MDQYPSWEANSHSASQEFSHHHVTRSCHWPLSWSRCIQPTTSHTISL